MAIILALMILLHSPSLTCIDHSTYPSLRAMTNYITFFFSASPVLFYLSDANFMQGLNHPVQTTLQNVRLKKDVSCSF